MLMALLLKAKSFVRVTLLLVFPVEANGGALALTHLSVTLVAVALILGTLSRKRLFLVASLSVALAHLHDLYRLLLGLLDFFPGLCKEAKQ